jgi:hypothetical protein
MTLAQVGAREHGVLYYLREYFVALPTQVSQWSKALDTSKTRSICQVA